LSEDGISRGCCCCCCCCAAVKAMIMAVACLHRVTAAHTLRYMSREHLGGARGLYEGGGGGGEGGGGLHLITQRDVAALKYLTCADTHTDSYQRGTIGLSDERHGYLQREHRSGAGEEPQLVLDDLTNATIYAGACDVSCRDGTKTRHYICSVKTTG
jgi:hypothetical protein